MHTLFITVKFVSQSQQMRAKKKKAENVKQKTWMQSPNGHIHTLASSKHTTWHFIPNLTYIYCAITSQPLAFIYHAYQPTQALTCSHKSISSHMASYHGQART